MSDRLTDAARFADGTHPVIMAAFYPQRSGQAEVISVSALGTRYPVHQYPEETTIENSPGHNATCVEMSQREGTGDPITIYDGFLALVPRGENGMIKLYIDTEKDPVLPGLIYRAREYFDKYPHWSIPQRVFTIGLLCFGHWGQRKHSIAEYGMEGFYLGEYIYTIDLKDIECAVFSMACQVVAQKAGIPLTFHTGTAARFSPFDHGIGGHAWNILHIGDHPRILDWTNYPPSIQGLFALARSEHPNTLWEKFRHTYGNFPMLYRMPRDSNLDEYYAMVSGDRMEFAFRNNVAYFTDRDTYLYSSDLPFGWSND